MEEYDTKYLNEYYNNYEDYLEEGEEENEIEYEDVLEDNNMEDIETEYNYVLSQNLRMEQEKKKESKE